MEKGKELHKWHVEIFNAINVYLTGGRHPKLKERYVGIWERYREAGGHNSLEYFEQNIDFYNVDGHCGY